MFISLLLPASRFEIVTLAFPPVTLLVLLLPSTITVTLPVASFGKVTFTTASLP